MSLQVRYGPVYTFTDVVCPSVSHLFRDANVINNKQKGFHEIVAEVNGI